MKSLTKILQERLSADSGVQELLDEMEEYTDLKGNVELWYQPYDRRPDTDFTIRKFNAKNKFEAVISALEFAHTYIDPDDIEIDGNHFTLEGETIPFDKMIDIIEESNGDGCDQIYLLKYKNDILIDGTDFLDYDRIADYLENGLYDFE